MLIYGIRVQLSGGKPFFFLAREEDIGRPNRLKKWTKNTERNIRRFQINDGERNHHLTRVDLIETYASLPYGPHFPLLSGTQISSAKKILELAPRQLCFPFFA